MPTADVNKHVPIARGMLRVDPAQGEHSAACRVLGSKGKDHNAKMVERGLCEEDESLTQIVSYCVITEGATMLCYGRTEKTDPRQIGKRSVGFGGHVTAKDGAIYVIENMAISSAGVLLGARRELREELGLKRVGSANLVGLIRDMSTPIGRVHLGYCYHVTLDHAMSFYPSEELHEVQFLNPLEITRRYSSRMNQIGKLESWSEIVLDNLDAFGF